MSGQLGEKRDGRTHKTEKSKHEKLPSRRQQNRPLLIDVRRETFLFVFIFNKKEAESAWVQAVAGEAEGVSSSALFYPS